MLINGKEKVAKKVNQLCEAVEARMILITPDGNLLLRNQSNETVIHNYVIISDSKVVSQFNGFKMYEVSLKEQNQVLGIMTESKWLIFGDNEETAVYVSGKKKPEAGERFLMTVFAEKYIETVCFNGDIYPAVYRVFLRPSFLEQQIMLTLSLAAGIKPECICDLQQIIIDGKDLLNE